MLRSVAGKWIVFLMSTLVPLLFLGCGDGKPWVETSLTEAPVSGIVTVRGKPADGGKVLFNANSSGRSVPIKEAKIEADGSYKVMAYLGVNQVSFDGEVAKKNRGVGLAKDSVEVKRGENTANFDLLGEGGKKIPYSIEDKGRSKGKSGR